MLLYIIYYPPLPDNDIQVFILGYPRNGNTEDKINYIAYNDDVGGSVNTIFNKLPNLSNIEKNQLLIIQDIIATYANNLSEIEKLRTGPAKKIKIEGGTIKNKKNVYKKSKKSKTSKKSKLSKKSKKSSKRSKTRK